MKICNLKFKIGYFNQVVLLYSHIVTSLLKAIVTA